MGAVRRALLCLVLLTARVPAQTPDIHFVPTATRIADAMLELANVTAADVVYDLGSGDGTVVIRAAEKYGARGVGVEIDRNLVKSATERARRRNVADKVSFVQANLFSADISEATVVALYLSPSTNRRLTTKLMHDLKPGARVVSHRYDMGDWRPDQERSIGGRKIYLWTIK